MSVPTLNLAEHSGTMPPATPLDYAAPPAPPAWSGSRRELWLGVSAAVLIAGGFGFLLFGALMALGLRDDEAGLIAFGTSCMALGGCFVGLLVWFRRNAR